MSSGRSDQLQPPDWCPAGEGLITPTAGRGPRTKGLSLRPSARAACEGLNHSASAASLLGDLSVQPGLEGKTPRFLGRETLEKPETASIITAPTPDGKVLRDPPHGSLHLMAQKLPQPRSRRPIAARYRRQRPNVTTRPTRSRSSHLLSALRVSESAVLRQLTCPFRAKSRSGCFSGGSVMPVLFEQRQLHHQQALLGPEPLRPPPRFGCAAFSSRHSAISGQASPNTSSSPSAGSRVTRSGYSRQGAVRRFAGLPAAFASASPPGPQPSTARFERRHPALQLRMLVSERLPVPLDCCSTPYAQVLRQAPRSLSLQVPPDGLLPAGRCGPAARRRAEPTARLERLLQRPPDAPASALPSVEAVASRVLRSTPSILRRLLHARCPAPAPATAT